MEKAETTSHQRRTIVERLSGQVPVEYRKEFSDKKIETNLTRTLMLSVFIIAVQVFLNVLNIMKPSTGDSGGETDIMKYVLLSLFTLTVGIIYLIISLVVRKGHLKNRTFRKVLPFTLLYLYCAIQMVFLYFNIESEAGINSFVIALILLGFFVIMSPAQCFASIAVLFGITITLLVVAGDDSNIFNIILLTDTWANVLIMTLLVSFMAYATYDMYRANFINSKRLEVSNERLDMLAKTDSLTGLYNRWGFYGIVDEEWSDFLSRPGEVAVFMFDIDFFKEYNDEYGHLAGDEVLKVVSKTIQKRFDFERDGIVCRFGGEEFLCLARLTSEEGAHEVAEQTRRLVAEAGIEMAAKNNSRPITVSGGYATFEGEEFIELDVLVGRADEALYKAKERGRNTICVAANK